MSAENSPVAVGIDLGTTYSCIAYVDEFGKAVVLKNFDGDLTTPSVVYFPEDSEEVTVGKHAKSNKAIEPDNVVDFVKRSIGRPNAEIFVGDKSYRPEEVSALIVRKMLIDAEQELGRKISQAVITCPAYFGINEREATAQAGIIAGLKGYTEDGKPNIIPEPTAAAFFYGLEKAGRDEVVLVYDLGGGTFDATLLAVKDGSVEAICIGGDHELGGKDWDDNITNYCIEEAVAQGADRDAMYSDAISLGDLALKVEEAKKTLSAREKVAFTLTLGGGLRKIELTREKFDELTRDRLERTIALCHEMLRDAGRKGYEKFDRILMVGGSTKMPQVRARLEQEFPEIPVEFNSPDEAVAKGAALFAQKLMIDRMISDELFQLTGQQSNGKDARTVAEENPEALKEAQAKVATTLGLPSAQVENMSKTQIRNITSKSFGIEVIVNSDPSQKVIANLIVKNSALPAEVTETFGTFEENQTSVRLRIMENVLLDNQVDLSAGVEIGEAMLENMPAGLAKGSPIEVAFILDEAGLLKFRGKDLTSGNLIEGEVQTSAVMNAEELEAAKERSRGITTI